MERNFLRSSLKIYSWSTFTHNIYINDIFFVDEAFLNDDADNTALYSVQKNKSSTNLFLRNFMYLQKWFHGNYMVSNPGKFYYITFELNTIKNEFVLEEGTIAPSADEHVVLGIKIYFPLTFYSHLKLLWKRVANKLNALTRIAPYLSHNPRRLI